jgi:hypothetical protein
MDRSLSTIALEDLESSNGDQQEYWLLAVRAARVAATLARDQEATVDTVPDWYWSFVGTFGSLMQYLGKMFRGRRGSLSGGPGLMR